MNEAFQWWQTTGVLLAPMNEAFQWWQNEPWCVAPSQGGGVGQRNDVKHVSYVFFRFSIVLEEHLVLSAVESPDPTAVRTTLPAANTKIHTNW